MNNNDEVFEVTIGKMVVHVCSIYNIHVYIYTYIHILYTHIHMHGALDKSKYLGTVPWHSR